MAYFMSRQDEPNPVLWLATRVGKMELSCPLGITRCVPQGKIFRSGGRFTKIFFRNLCCEKYFLWQLNISCGLCSNGIGKQENWNPQQEWKQRKQTWWRVSWIYFATKSGKHRKLKLKLRITWSHGSDIISKETRIRNCVTYLRENWICCCANVYKIVKKLDSTEYEPVSLTSFQQSLQRSLNKEVQNLNI